MTGTPDQLKAVWKAYGINVIPSKDGDVQHDTNMYFIDKTGTERYVGYPDSDAASLSDWSKGIAFFAKKLV